MINYTFDPKKETIDQYKARTWGAIAAANPNDPNSARLTASLPTLPQGGGAALPGQTPGLPDIKPTGNNLLDFKNAIAAIDEMARQNRSQFAGSLAGAVPEGTLNASSFGDIIQMLNRGGNDYASKTAANALEAYKASIPDPDAALNTRLKEGQLAIQQSNLLTDKLQRAKISADISIANATDSKVNPDVLQGMLNVYKSTGVLPAFGLSAKSPLRAQFFAALGADGGNEIVTEANMNKTIRVGLTAAYRVQQNQYAANQTAIGTLEKQLALAQTYSDKVGRSGSPLVNKYILATKSGVFGDPDTAALHNIVITASYELAKITSGSSASIAGVTVSSAEDAQKLLNSAMSKGQFNEVLGLMAKEASFRLSSQKETIASLQNDLNNVGQLSSDLKNAPTVNNSPQPLLTPTQIPPGYYQASDGLLYKK